MHAGGEPTIRKEKMFVILTNRIDQKQTTVADRELFALKKHVPRNNSPDLPVARNIACEQAFGRARNWGRVFFFQTESLFTGYQEYCKANCNSSTVRTIPWVPEVFLACEGNFRR